MHCRRSEVILCEVLPLSTGLLDGLSNDDELTMRQYPLDQPTCTVALRTATVVNVEQAQLLCVFATETFALPASNSAC